MMGTPFPNPVAGGGGELVIPQIRSPNYVAGSTGWTIKITGSAEFNDLTIRGQFLGTDFVINSTGAFFYSGTPAPGNLSASVVPGSTTVTDPEGNTAQPGFTTYGSSASIWSQLLTGLLQFNSSATQFSPASVASGSPGVLAIVPGLISSGDTDSEILMYSAGANSGTSLIALIAQQVNLTGNLLVQTNLTVDGTLTVGGSTDTGTPTNNSTSTNGLTNGTINGTSGGASAGTAHTHGAGSYAVNNGQHSHNLNSHQHPL
jgi:hypothetical protein